MISVNAATAVEMIKEKAAYKGRYFYFAKFSELPSASEKNQWQKSGFEFLSGVADKTYIVSSVTVPSPEFFKEHKIHQVAIVEPGLKISKALSLGKSSRLATEPGGRLAVLAAIFKGLPLPEIKKTLTADGFTIQYSPLESNGVLTFLLTPQQVNQLAAYPFVVYIQPVSRDRGLNEKVRVMTGAYRLNTAIANGGENLKGADVVIGVGDDTDPSFHPDVTDRIINRTPGIVNTHGAHTTGTVAGGGLLQPDKQGVAPQAIILSQYFSGVWLNAATYIQDFGMVLTNNSYGAQAGDCDYYGVYDLYSELLDQQAIAFPNLLHVFAAGNSGDDICSPLPQHYGTVLGSYQSAKNVITVGRTDYNQLASGSSSSGPVSDGRLKPEITSLGIVESLDGGSGYFVTYGTSQSAPAITGGLGLLYEKYRQLNFGSDPQGALMKAILLNGARDIGNPGPDFRHGYGFMHLENSLRILKNHQYLGGTMLHGMSKDSVINVPAGTAELKVLLYWHDPAALPLAAKTIVNDLDLEVIGPDGSVIIYPKKLNPSSPFTTATEGTDHINNSEQVVIKTPLPGNYTIRVKGYEVLGNNPSQEYFVAFDNLPQGLIIRTPVKNDNWSVSVPDEFGIFGIIISWDDEGTIAGNYKLEYSLNNGGSWNNIIENLKDSCRIFGWRPPAGTATNLARVRISKNNTAFSTMSEVFTIIDRPVYTLASNPCEGYITINWSEVPGADDYEVIMKKGPEMVPVAIVVPPTLTYTIGGLNRDSTYYVAVRARKAGIAGRWNKANGKIPNSGSCAGNISDGDLKLDSILSPLFGRQFTSNSFGSNETIKVRIKNLDNAAVAANSYNVKYSIDGSAFVSETGTSNIAAQGSHVHSFTGIDLSGLGSHVIKTVVENVGIPDKITINDTFTVVIKNIANPPVSLASTFTETFETAPVFTLSKTTYGLPGIDRWDYLNSDQFARARSFVNTGIALSGNRAITLDVSKTTPYVKNPANNLLGNFNLSNYNTSSDVRLDFQFKQHGPGQVPNTQNKVWIRGSDKDTWIAVYDLSANQPEEPGTWKRSQSLELNDFLSTANPQQQFSTSTQVRFGQFAEYGMSDNTNLAGLSFDDIRLYIANNDIQILSIDTPAIYSCGLNNLVPVRIKIRNSTGTAVTNIPVRYSVNSSVENDNAVAEIITTIIPANSTFVYQFLTPINLGGFGANTIEAMVDYPGDNQPENNITSVIIYNQPVITNFPYLENFESSGGLFFTTGLNSSWEFGKPASIKIDAAASGSNAWKTRLAGNHNDREKSQLNTPCFDISKLANPTLSFSMAYDIEDCTSFGVLCDAAWVEYSSDGVNWTKLGIASQGTNWYDDPSRNVWLKRQQTHWHVATFSLPKGIETLQLRFVFNSDEATNYEGIAIDDVHIYDLINPLYTTNGTSSAINQQVSGNEPVHFSASGKLIASIVPNNNDLGNTEVKAYLFSGPVRNNGEQYYGNRNITIKPQNTISGNATVRFYFTDKEVDSMRLAKTCAVCTNPKDFTFLGVTQYTDADKLKEDGDLGNNTNGISHFYSGNNLQLVPYDIGYYAEFSVAGFSEFWLNDGKGINLPLPARWLSFEAEKLNSGIVKLTWSTGNESGVSKYEIQVARSREEMINNQFVTFGSVPAKNSSAAEYSYPDEKTGKTGSNYYRIKQIDSNGSFYYSPVILVQFPANDFIVKMFPNPVKDILVVNIESTDNKQLQLAVFNMAGQQLFKKSWSTLSGITRQEIPFGNLGFSKGVYTIAITDGKSWWYNKVVKE
ncbi:MAG: S8 family serine peptidase [Bacteroidota bacterium]